MREGEKRADRDLPAFRARAAHVARTRPRTPDSARPRVPTPRARPCLRSVGERLGGTSGGTPRVKDQEIRVRTGNWRFGRQSRRGRANGDVSKTCVENAGVNLAPQVGFEPTTLRLTAQPVVAASRCKHKTCRFIIPVWPETGGTLGVLDSPYPRVQTRLLWCRGQPQAWDWR